MVVDVRGFRRRDLRCPNDQSPSLARCSSAMVRQEAFVLAETEGVGPRTSDRGIGDDHRRPFPRSKGGRDRRRGESCNTLPPARSAQPPQNEALRMSSSSRERRIAQDRNPQPCWGSGTSGLCRPLATQTSGVSDRAPGQGSENVRPIDRGRRARRASATGGLCEGRVCVCVTHTSWVLTEPPRLCGLDALTDLRPRRVSRETGSSPSIVEWTTKGSPPSVGTPWSRLIQPS